MLVRLLILVVSLTLLASEILGQDANRIVTVGAKSDVVPLSNVLPPNRIVILQGDSKCRKCEASVAGYLKEYGSIAGEYGITRVQLVSRLADTVGHTSKIQVDQTIYVKREWMNQWDSRDYENKWVYYDTSKSVLVFVPLDCTHELYKLEKRGGSDRLKRNKLSERSLPSLIEQSMPLIRPVFNASFDDSVIVVGSRNEIRLDVFNVNSGARINTYVFSDTLFDSALEKGEWFESDNPFEKPEVITAEMSEGGRIVFAGRILSGRNGGEGRVRVGDRYFIAMYDTLSGKILWQKKPRAISGELSKIALHNTKLDYPLLYASNCQWGLKIGEVYESSCARIVNMESGVTEAYAVCDSAYRILNIGKNYLSGYVCVVGGDVYTAQPLSPWINNEATGKAIYLDDEHYNGYYNYLHTEAERIAKLSDRSYERASKYEMEVLVRGLFRIANDYLVVAIMKKVNNRYQNSLVVYETKSGKKVDEQQIEPGWTIQKGNEEILHIHLHNEKYEMSVYSMR